MPARKDIKIFRGDTKYITFRLKTKVNTAPEGDEPVWELQPIDLTGQVFTLLIKHPAQSIIPITGDDFVVLDAENGVAQACIDSDTSNSLQVGNETRYEVRTSASGVITTYFYGLLIIEDWIVT